MRCPRCLNTDPTYFYKGSKGYYCRRCIGFKRVLIEEILAPKEYPIQSNGGEYSLDYELTVKQKEISHECLKLSMDSDVLLYCVTGAGKTELVIESISWYLKNQKRVAYAISRREVVLELYERFKKIFKTSKVIRVCEGYTDEVYGDLIVCTTHQLYRYPKTFDLLILDEVDAFPFKGNEILENIALNSVKGHIIYSTATLDDNTRRLMNKRHLEVLSLYRRPHNHDLVIPKVRYMPFFMIIIYIYFYLKKHDGQYIIFVETKKLCRLLYELYKRLLSITLVYSDHPLRENNIHDFKDNKYQYMIATSVLERGITIAGVNIIIVDNHSGVFDKASYVQMCGRVCRSFKYPTGDSLVVINHYSKVLKEAISEMEEANAMSLL